MKRFLISVSALSLLAAPAASFAQDADRQARREARQAERAQRQADGGDAQRQQQRAERQAERAQREGQFAQVDQGLAERNARALAEAEENARRVEAGQPRVGEDRVRPADRRYAEGADDRQDRRENRQERREDRRDDRQDWRQDNREDRREYRQDRRDDRRDYRQDQRRRSWSYQGRNYNAFRVDPYRWAPGFRSFNFGIGTYLPSPFISQTYVLRDYYRYGLPRPPAGTYWLRVDNDVLLVSYRRNRVLEVIRDVFYYDDYGRGW